MSDEMSMADIVQFMKRSADKSFRQFMNGDAELALRQIKWVTYALEMAEERIKQQLTTEESK